LSKSDLLPILDDFSPERAETYLRKLANPAPLIHSSAKSGDGLDSWLKWLRETVHDVQLESKNIPAAIKHHHHEHGSDPRQVPGHS
jgi:hydrogenase nickel incorporation protein HypB